MKKKDRIQQNLGDVPRLIRQRDVIRQVQSEGILKRLVASGWLVPVVRERKFCAYRRSDVDSCVERILSGEMPPPLPSRRGALEAPSSKLSSAQSPSLSVP